MADDPAPDPADSGATPPPAPPAPTPPPPGDDLKKALEAERKLRRDAERKLADQSKASMSDLDRAVAEAEERGRQAVRAEFGSKLVEAKIEAVAAGRNVNVEALLEGVDRSKFMTDDGEANTAAITAWMDKIAPQDDQTQKKPPQGPDLAQGARGPAPALNTATASGRELLTAAFETDIHRK
jgi:hypothetical protein